MSSTMEEVVCTDEIRQIQMLALLFASVSPSGKLQSLLQKALSTPVSTAATEAAGICQDFSNDGIRRHLEAVWAHHTAKHSSDEAKLVALQNDGDTMKEAVKELIAAEYALGFKVKFEASR